MNLSLLPSIAFCETDTAAVEAAVIASYEEITEKSLYPGSPERLFIEAVASSDRPAEFSDRLHRQDESAEFVNRRFPRSSGRTSEHQPFGLGLCHHQFDLHPWASP